MATETLRLILDATNKGLVAGMKEGEVATGALQAKTSLLQGALGKVGIQGVNTGTLLKTGLVGGAAVAGLALGKMALDGVDKFEKLTGEVRAFQRVSGATAEQSSALLFTMKRLGIEPDAAAASVGRLSQRLGTGSVDLQKFGVEVQKSSDGSIDLAGTLGNIAERMAKLGPGTEQAALGFSAFGKGWQTLLPFLSKGKDELQAIADIAAKQGLIFNQEDLNTGRELTLATRDLKTAWTGLEITLAENIAPTLVTILKTTTDIVTKVKDIAGLGGGSKLGHGLFGGWEDILNGGSEAAGTFADKQKAASDAVKKVADLAAEGKRGTQEYKDAVLAAAKANQELDTTQAQVNASFQTTTEQALAAANAMLGLWSADLAAANAAAKVTEAQNAYAAALEDKGIGAAFKAAEAERNYESAVIAAAQAAGAAAVAKLGPEATAQEKAKANIDAEVQALAYLAATTKGPVHDAIVQHLSELNKIPGDKKTNIIIASAEAEAGLKRVKDALDALRDKKVTVTQQLLLAGGNPAAGYSGAGHTYLGIDGHMHYTSDNSIVPGTAMGGIVTRPQIRLLGEAGPEAIVPLSRGGWGGNTYVTNINAGSIIAQDDLVSQVEEAIRVRVRTDGPRGF